MVDNWPNERSIPLKKSHHALGVVNAEWYSAELNIQFFIWFYFQGAVVRAQAVTIEMSNRNKIFALKSLLKDFESDNERKEALEHGIKLFEKCQTNRNTLVHSQLRPLTTMAKLKKPWIDILLEGR